MRQLSSEIFDEYIKIAQKEGLVKESDYADSRIGTDTTEVIEMLYGVKPNDEKKDEIYSPILEKAHPDTVVISPAEDRFNGVLEDLKQRQSIMAYVALKTPDGAVNQRRYVRAQEELLKSLVRVGFMMDNEDKPELMKLADSCAGRLEKQAFAWLPVMAVVGVLGALALINRTNNSRQNVVNNAETVAREILGLQQPLSPIVQDIYNNVVALKETAAQVTPIMVKFISVENAIEYGMKNPKELHQVEQYMIKLQEVRANIPKYISKLEAYSKIEGGSEGYSPDWWQKIKDVGRLMFSITTRVERIINALGGLSESIDVAVKQAQSITSGVHSYAPQIEEKLKQDPGLLNKIMPNWMKERLSDGAKESPKEDELTGPVSNLINKTLSVG